MRRALVIIIVLGLVLASATAAAQGQGRGRGGDRDRVQDDDRGSRAPVPIGEFVVAPDATVTGEHLSFNYSDTGISAFRTQNVTLFDLLVVGEARETDRDDARERERGRAPRVDAEGAFFRVRTENFTFRAHDNPGVVSKLDVDGTFTLTFADGVILLPGEEGSVRFTFDGLNGTARGDDLGLSGHVLTGSDGLLLFLDVPRGSFDKHRGDIGQAIVKGHVGAEASFLARATGNATETLDVEQEVVSYGNVTMTTVKAERGNLTVLIEGHGLEGRVLVFNVDGRMIGADAADKLNVTLDNLTIAHAATLEDALDPDDDGFLPEYYLVYDPAAEAFQMILTVPHYSVHTLTVATLIEVLPPSVTIGVLVGALLVVPMALVLFRRK